MYISYVYLNIGHLVRLQYIEFQLYIFSIINRSSLASRNILREYIRVIDRCHSHIFQSLIKYREYNTNRF